MSQELSCQCSLITQASGISSFVAALVLLWKIQHLLASPGLLCSMPENTCHEEKKK